MMHRHKFLFVIVAIFVVSATNLRDTELLQKIEAFHRSIPTEKVYLHLNKKLFTIGESIWFKAYLVDGTFHREDTVSGTLYVELINMNEQRTVVSKMLEVRHGVASGDFYLADTFSTSTYQIRAYTSWMRNFDEELMYSSNISVVNYDTSLPTWEIVAARNSYPDMDSVELTFRNSDEEAAVQEQYDFSIMDEKGNLVEEGSVLTQVEGHFDLKFQLPPWDNTKKALVAISRGAYHRQFAINLNDRPVLQFFPEGGEMVANVVNVVAFEVKDPGGSPLTPEGALFNQDSVMILPLTEKHEGRGLLIFRPEVDNKYYARIRYRNKWHYYALPNVRNSGIVMSAINNYDSLLAIRIASNDQSEMYTSPLTLIGQVRGKVYWNGKIELSNGSTRFKIPKSAFPSGVLQLTLFDQDDLPISERLVFIYHQEQATMSISAEKDTYTPRDNVRIQLQVHDARGNPVNAKLSATVLDCNQYTNSDKENILSYLLLSSDIAGPVNDPLQYFKDNSKQTQLALDLLMLTRGWRRFKWEDVINMTVPELTHQPERGFRIRGTLTQPWNNNPVENRIVKLAIFDTNPIYYSTSKTNELGRFSFSNLTFRDSANLVFQTETKRGRKQDFILALDTDVAPELGSNFDWYPTVTVDMNYVSQRKKQREVELAYIRDTSTIVLEEVTIQSTKIDPDRERVKMHGEPDYRLKPQKEDAQSFVFLTDYMLTTIPGIRIDGFGIDASISSLGVSVSGNRSPPMLLLDGFQMPPKLINTIPIQYIETIEVIKHHANVYGRRGTEGLVAIYTKRGVNGVADSRGIINRLHYGYSVPREFYTPNYEVPQDFHVMPDNRVNLMWVPDLHTNSLGNASFTYFNSDQKTKVAVLIEGITEDGMPVAGKYIYEIK